MTPTNRALARIFKEMGAIYTFTDGINRFRALAYERAARVLAGLEDDISRYIENDQLEEVPGIGESIAEKIREYATTGKIAKYEALKATVPHQLLEMLEIKGLGPQSLKRIHQELGIETKEGIIQALQDGSTDMHQLSNFNYVKLGVLIARRAWCTADDILNTGKWKEVQAFVAENNRAISALSHRKNIPSLFSLSSELKPLSKKRQGQHPINCYAYSRLLSYIEMRST